MSDDLNLTVEDIAAMRAQGQDFREYLRVRLAASQPRTEPPQQAATPVNFGPLHRPGAWPAGTRTTGPTCHPDCGCALTSKE
jgi:hypothetical protein